MSPALQEACLTATKLKQVADYAHRTWMDAVDRAIEMANRQTPGLPADVLAQRMDMSADAVKSLRERRRT